MKKLNLVIVLSSALILASGFVQADELRKNSNNQNLSKRPYQEVLPDSAYNKQENWEGATLISDDAPTESGESGADSIRKININMLGKRPYMD